ncbi:MAG: hypothetical protein ACTS5I_16615 [Rhodanobacter sp.]
MPYAPISRQQVMNLWHAVNAVLATADAANAHESLKARDVGLAWFPG